MSYSVQSWVDLPTQTTPLSAARLAHMETGIGNALDRTDTGTQTVQGSVTLSPEKRITLTANAATGSVSRLIEFHATDIVDRPWMSWFDQNSRHVVASGAHDTLNAGEGGAQLKQFEIKTVADATSGNPTELRTRLAIQYDVQRGTWGVNFIDNFEINQGENPIATTPGSVTNFGLRLRTAPQDTISGTVPNFVAAQLVAQVDASDNVSAFLDCNVPYRSGGSLFPGNKTATLNIFRNTNTSSASSPALAIKKGDGTNTNSFVFTAPTGALTMTGSIGVNGSSAPAKPTVSGAKGSNAALGSLLTALVAYGFVTDSTTA